MKKVIITLILLFLLTIPVQAQKGIQLPDQSVLKKDSADEETSTSEAPSLWGMDISGEIITLPSDAFAADILRPVVSGISADGKQFLIAGCSSAPYLWNSESGEKLYLEPGNEPAKANLDMRYEGLLAKQPEAVRDNLKRKYADAAGDPKLALLMDEDLSGGGRGTTAQAADGNYMLMANLSLGIGGLIECSTGKYYLPEDGNPTLPAYPDGKILVWTPVDLSVWDPKTDVMEKISYDFTDWRIVTARLLPDGSTAAVIKDYSTIPGRKNQDISHALLIIRQNGETEQYDLGKIRYSDSPDTILSGKDGSQLLLFSPAYISRDRPYRIDRRDGSVSLMLRAEAGFQAIPLPECMDENGKAVLPADPYAEIIFIPLREMNDGTILVFDLNSNELLLADLKSLESFTLLTEDQLMKFSEYRQALFFSAPPIAGNGYDLICLKGKEELFGFKNAE